MAARHVAGRHATARHVAVLADDLIWATRLARAVEAAGSVAVPIRDVPGLERAIAEVEAVVVDLTARGYDGIDAVATAAGAGRRVLAVGQHDDRALRQRALDAGADRVVAYRALAERGGSLVASWLADSGTADDRRSAASGHAR